MKRQGTPHSQSTKTEALPSDSLVSYPEHSLGWRSYPSAEMQLTYSTAQDEYFQKYVFFEIITINKVITRQ